MSDMYENKNRTSYYKKDNRLEEALLDLNQLIDGVQYKDMRFSCNQPIILIMGCARSGSTLMLQWLASLGLFSYPSNLIARFYSNPYIGIRVQQALLEYDPLNQIGFNQGCDAFKSSLGKTTGALSPSEYWYFWREYFKFEDDKQKLTKAQLKTIEGDAFVNKLYAFEHLTQKPLVLKGMLLNWNIPYLYQLNKNFIFINLTREPFYNAQSLLLARETYFNDRNKWYSFKPPEYNFLKNDDPIKQVAGQVIYTQKAVQDGLLNIPEQNVLNISYDNFCSNPEGFLKLLTEKYNQISNNKILDYDEYALSQNSFIANKKVNLKEDEVEYLKEQVQFFKDKI
ncbi:sulfotransferase [Thalassobellus sediminis]|uniref:sulfotransferase n=1 Tax=Thalassobellus sediminis TaxID=3367753 RepID=UPI00379DEC2E